MTHDHNHAPANYNLSFALGVALNVMFVVVEFSYGLFANSLALIAAVVQVRWEKLSRYQSQLLPAAAEVLDLTQESYRLGKTGLTNVILAQQASQQIR